MTTNDIPDAALAGALAARATGYLAKAVRRFTTGSQHYVFEVELEGRAPVVVRISLPRDRALAAGSVKFSRLLRPLGVTLPAILAEEIAAPFPYVVFERLPGTDLGNTLAPLSDSQLDAIAAEVARAQGIVAKLPNAGRYGYAVEPAAAPCSRWSEIVAGSLNRSRERLIAAKLFDLRPLEAVEALAAGARAELDAQPAVPFLHDTTTKNVIISPEGRFSGIVDVDDLCFGDPRYVVALTLTSLVASDGPVHYVNSWMKLAGFRDDGLFRLYVAVCLVDFMAEHGQVFNGNQRPSLPEARQHLLDVFAKNLPLVFGIFD